MKKQLRAPGSTLLHRLGSARRRWCEAIFHTLPSSFPLSTFRRRPGPLTLVEQLESRVLLTSNGALEVWAGNTDLSGNPSAFFSPDQNGYTQIGVTNSPNTSVVFDTGGTQYNFFVIVSRGQVQIDSVEGSDSTFLTGVDSSGNLSQNGNVATLGTQVNDNGGTFAGYAEFANPDAWTNLTIQTGSMGVMLEGQINVESDYLPGAANPYNLAAEVGVSDNGLITSGEVRTPAGIWYPLSLNTDSGSSNAQWRFKENFSLTASLNTTLPNGIYTFVVNSPFGTTTTQFSYSKSPLTPVPSLIGLFDGATGISTTKTFNWNPITDANPNDNINFELDDSSQNSVVSQQLDTSATTSGPVALDPNSNYSVELSLNSFTQSTTNADGFNFNTDTSNETDLLFTTSASVIPPALSITSVGFPDGTIHPGDWLELPITGGNSGGNAIGKSGGVVVPVQYQVVLSTTKTFGTGNIIIGTGTIGGGSGGGSIGGESFNGGGPIVQIPANITPGTYWVGLKGDSTNVLATNTGSPTSAFSATQITISPSGTIAVTSPGSQNATTGHSQSISLGSFTAANTTTPYSVDVNWGDGSADSIFAVAGTGAIPATAHTYAANGNNTVTVTIDDWDGEAEKTSTFNVTVTGPTKLAFAQQPSNATAGVGNSPAITVNVEDQFGNIATTDNSTVTLTVNSGPQSGTLTTAAVNGVATFTDTALDLAGTYTLKVTDGLLTSATSHSFTVTAAAPAQLAFAQQPSDITTNHADSPAIAVKVEDQFGNLVTTDTSNVALSINTGPGALSGTLTVAAINGIATFSGVKLDTAGTYTLQAADASFAAATTSHSFVVSVAADHAPTLTAMKPFATALGGLPFTITYAQFVANATGLADADGDTLQFLIDSPSAFATFKLDGVTQNAFPFAVAPGNTLTITPAPTASGALKAFSIRAFDGTLPSAKDLPVSITTIPEPNVSITAATTPATEINNGVKGLGVVTFSRTGSTTLPLTVNYTVNDTSGTPNNGTNYNTLSGTVIIPAKASSITVPIVPVDNITRGGNLVVTLSTVDGGVNYVLGTKTSAAVTIVDNNLAPFSVAGKSLSATITAGAAPFAASGSYQLFFNALDSSFVIVGGPTLVSALGTFTYTRTSPTTAALDLTGAQTGTSDGTITFTSATAAIFTFAQDSDTGSQTSKVTLVAAPKTNFAPASLAGRADQHTIVSGTGILASSGKDQTIFSQSSDLLVVAGTAPVPSSINHYTYLKFGPNLGIVTFTNAAGDNGFTTVLYTSATSATYVTTLDAGDGSQHGKITVAPTPRATLAPVSLSGQTLMSVGSTGTAPFTLKSTNTLVLSDSTYSDTQPGSASSTGTYTYEMLTPTIGFVSFDDSEIGPSFNVLTFTSPTQATYVLANIASGGWQRGKATLT